MLQHVKLPQHYIDAAYPLVRSTGFLSVPTKAAQYRCRVSAAANTLSCPPAFRTVQPLHPSLTCLLAPPPAAPRSHQSGQSRRCGRWHPRPGHLLPPGAPLALVWRRNSGARPSGEGRQWGAQLGAGNAVDQLEGRKGHHWGPVAEMLPAARRSAACNLPLRLPILHCPWAPPVDRCKA